jgi:hypothetical protein
MNKRAAAQHTDVYTAKQKDDPNEPIKHPDDNKYRVVGEQKQSSTKE